MRDDFDDPKKNLLVRLVGTFGTVGFTIMWIGLFAYALYYSI